MWVEHSCHRDRLALNRFAAPLRDRASRRSIGLAAAGLVTLAWACGAPRTWAQSKTSVAASRSPLQATYDAYILGRGDSLQIELLNIPELSGTFSIGPDGTLYLPRLRALFVEGLTVEELRYFLTEQFKAYVKNPQLYVKPVGYRAVRVYVGGEINRPGYYLLSGSQRLEDQISIREGVSPLDTLRQTTSLQDFAAARVRLSRIALDDITTLQGVSAQGVTPYSNLGEVQVVRKQPTHPMAMHVDQLSRASSWKGS